LWLAAQAGIPAEAIADRIPLNGTIDASGPQAAAREAASLVRRGFGTLKLKVGLGDNADVQRAAAARAAVGPEVTLRIDANGAWTEARARNLLPQFGSASNRPRLRGPARLRRSRPFAPAHPSRSRPTNPAARSKTSRRSSMPGPPTPS